MEPSSSGPHVGSSRKLLGQSFGIALLKIFFRTVAAVFLFVATLIVALAVAFFASPSLKITADFAADLIAKYAPENLKIGFSSFTLEINRPVQEFWSKTVVLEAKNLCVRYNQKAVDLCIDDLRLALTGGFDGKIESGQSRWYPHLEAIEPLKIVGAAIHVSLPAFPKSEDETPSKFDWLGFVRTEVLPKWDVEGSRVNVTEFSIETDPKARFLAQFDLQPGTDRHDIEAILHEFKQANGPIRAQAQITITRPKDWGAPNSPSKDRDEISASHVSQHGWKINADANLDLDSGRQLKLKADAAVRNFQDFDFRIQTFFKGIDFIREARFEGAVAQDDFKGVTSFKGGSVKSELQALDFLNCEVVSNLKRKDGAVRCGPQSVRLQIRERSLMHRPDLFLLSPELDFKVTNVEFGDKKSADYSISVLMDHLGIARLGAKLSGHFESAKETTYNLQGRIDFVVPMFQEITKLLKITTYAVPAPFNSLDGAVALQANVDFDKPKGRPVGGKITYQAATRLDSDFQAVHLDISGKTDFRSVQGTFVPDTDVTLNILQLNVSAPRFELRSPPAFKPDGRFRTLNQKVVSEQLADKTAVASAPFKFHLKTASNQAFQIATNLTKSAIPISIDAVYDNRSAEKSPVTGSVQVGRTPVELFKRNAIVQNIRVDLLGSGDNRLNGLVQINYGDYAISILLLGQVSDPQVRFVSDPPLDDNQIVSVLLFGRPQHELGDDQQTTVSNTKAAMADAVLGLGSLYFLASTPIESVGYDPDTGRVIARVGLGGGASIELGAGGQDAGSGVGFRKRLSKDFTFRTEVNTLGTSGSNAVSALVEWVKRF